MTISGEGSAPTPGVLGRGALGSCLAMGIVQWAARMNVPINRLEIEVEVDWDARGYLGLSEDIPPGYTGVRINVNIDSPAGEKETHEVIDAAVRHSSYVDVFRRANSVIVEIKKSL